MLVLTRQRSQTIEIKVPPSSKETVITLMIVDIRGDKVRLGIKAPIEVDIQRDDVKREKR